MRFDPGSLRTIDNNHTNRPTEGISSIMFLVSWYYNLIY